MLQLALAAGCFWPLIVWSQGELEFANYGGGVNAPIYEVDGKTPLSGPAFFAGLYAAAPGDRLQPRSQPVPFLAGGGSGYFMGGIVAVQGVSYGGRAVVQVVAWRASDGPTFEAANHPGGHVGASSVFEVGLASPTGLAGLYGLQSFSLEVVVPEPSVTALVLVGGSALALGHRFRRVLGRAKHRPYVLRETVFAGDPHGSWYLAQNR